MTSCQKKSWKPIRYGGMLLGSGYPRTTNYIGAPILDHTYCVYIQRSPSLCLRSCMKEFVEVTPEEGRWCIGHSPKDIGGRTCKGRPRSTPRSAISARDLLRISTNPEGFSTPSLARDRSRSGVLILSDLFLKPQGTSDTS